MDSDKLANWGYALGLIVPVLGLAAGGILLSRGDARGPWVIGWSLIVPAVVIYLFASGTL